MSSGGGGGACGGVAAQGGGAAVRERACGSAAQRRRRHGGARLRCMAGMPWRAVGRLLGEAGGVREKRTHDTSKLHVVVSPLVAERNLHVVFRYREAAVEAAHRTMRAV